MKIGKRRSCDNKILEEHCKKAVCSVVWAYHVTGLIVVCRRIAPHGIFIESSIHFAHVAWISSHLSDYAIHAWHRRGPHGRVRGIPVLRDIPCAAGEHARGLRSADIGYRR